VPETVAFITGWRRRHSTVARMMKGRKVSFCPVSASNSAFICVRIRATRVRSISKKLVTCAATCLACRIWSAVSRRIFDIGST